MGIGLIGEREAEILCALVGAFFSNISFGIFAIDSPFRILIVHFNVCRTRGMF